MITIDRAMADENLLGAALGDPTPWRVWRAILKAAFAIPLTDEEAEIFAIVSGGRKPPSKPVSELWVIAGRRGGKSRMAALVSAYAGAFIAPTIRLAPGEIGHVLALAPSKAQAGTVRDYCHGFYERSPILSQMVRNVTGEEIRLDGNVSIGVHAANFRTVRGRSVLCAVLDEAAFFRDESSATPDLEIYRAILPALATTGGMLISISSPYRKAGLLYAKHRDHFGRDDDDVLVIQAPSALLNPTLDTGVIDRAKKLDAEAARSEWEAAFRSDLSALFDDRVIDEAIDEDRPLELAPRDGIRYTFFTDASAGRHDAFTCAVAHREGGRVVLDLVRGRKAPFDPQDVAAEYAGIAKAYGCRKVIGDAYAGEWVAGSFKNAGLQYERAPMAKSGLYLESLPLFMQGAVSIPNEPNLIRELRLLERRTSRAGKDIVDHPSFGNATDDYANAACGAIVSLGTRTRGRSMVDFL